MADRDGYQTAVTETPLEQCQRHVFQGAERIARQKSVARLLEDAGHKRMLLETRVMLTAMKATQRLGKEHLAREVARTNQTRTPPRAEADAVRWHLEDLDAKAAAVVRA